MAHGTHRHRSPARRTRRSGYGGGAARWALLAVGFLSLSCRQASKAPAQRESLLETVEVGEGADMAIQPDDDQQAVVTRDDRLIGVLPGDFPVDLPVYTPSSLIDFGQVGPGLNYVTLQTDRPLPEARAGLLWKLAEHGWHPLDDEPDILRKNDRQIRIHLGEGSFGTTEIRIDYPSF